MHGPIWTMAQGPPSLGASSIKLGALSIICIKSNKLSEISFDDLIKEFVVSKSRRKNILNYSALGYRSWLLFIFQ